MGFGYNNCVSDDLLVQQRCGWSGAKGRLKREDCELVKHDKVFSQWKILVGPIDSIEHRNSALREGVGKFEIQNLPAAQIGPGVYELGVTAPSWSQASNKQQSARPLKREDVIPVYIGQAANIRQRLEKYGQANAHLESGPRSSKQNQDGSNSAESRSPSPSRSPRIVQGRSGVSAKSAGSGHGLFSEVFALGCSIAFRWAHTESKVVAEQVESELLAVFDYAWNKGINGTRRSRDILAKLFMAWPSKDAKSFCNLLFSPGKRTALWLLRRRRRAVGIKVALRKPHDTTTSTNPIRSVMRNLCFLMTIQPHGSIRQGSIRVASLDRRCGVVTSKGVPCTAPPLRGRKRCLQHQETQRLRVLTPDLASPRPSEQISMVSMKLQSEPVKTKSCLSGGFLDSEHFLPIKTRTSCKVPAAAKEEKPVEGKRHNSLSFNTWMKGDTDQRIHDSSDMIELATEILYQKPTVMKQAKEQPVSGRRVQHVVSKYAFKPDDDGKRR